MKAFIQSIRVVKTSLFQTMHGQISQAFLKGNNMTFLISRNEGVGRPIRAGEKSKHGVEVATQTASRHAKLDIT